MKYSFGSVVFTMIFGVIGCSDGKSGVSFSDFRDAVEARAGDGANECSATEDPNQCIADSFQNANPAYTVFSGQGTDSQTGSGVAINANSQVYFLNFDADPSGGGSSNNGRITTRECVNPQLSGPGVGSFSCE